MKICPWCEGRRVVGKLLNSMVVHPRLRRAVPAMAVYDTPCGTCDGKGEVTEDKHRELTGGKP